MEKLLGVRKGERPMVFSAPIARHLKRACNVIQPYRKAWRCTEVAESSDDGRPGIMLNPRLVVSRSSIEKEQGDFHESEECFEPPGGVTANEIS